MVQPTAPTGGLKESGLFPPNGNRHSVDGSDSELKPYKSNGTLSVDFATPLVGVQRSERIQQMVKSHVSILQPTVWTCFNL